MVPGCLPRVGGLFHVITVMIVKTTRILWKNFCPGTYYNFCLPHASLRQALPQPEPTHGPGSVRQWRPQTPAMAAGWTDHVWILREVLMYRVPPWPQPQVQ